jgi:hypothetical protein
MIANWLEKTLILTPEAETDAASLNVIAAACNPKNWSTTSPHTTGRASSATGEVSASQLPGS